MHSTASSPLFKQCLTAAPPTTRTCSFTTANLQHIIICLISPALSSYAFVPYVLYYFMSAASTTPGSCSATHSNVHLQNRRSQHVCQHILPASSQQGMSSQQHQASVHSPPPNGPIAGSSQGLGSSNFTRPHLRHVCRLHYAWQLLSHLEQHAAHSCQSTAHSRMSYFTVTLLLPLIEPRSFR
jgi:hypothetical protein